MTRDVTKPYMICEDCDYQGDDFRGGFCPNCGSDNIAEIDFSDAVKYDPENDND